VADQADKLRALASQVKSGAIPGPLPAEQQVPGPFSKRRARVITVSSGKGGVGKTNLSINLALALRKLGKEVLLFDADLGLANVDVLLGISPRHNLQHFMQGQRSLQEVISEGPLGLKVIASGNGVSQMADLSPQERERMLSHFSLIEESVDIVIVDTGAGISLNVVSFALAADECLVVTTPEPTARLDAYGLIKTLNQEGYAGALRLIVNMAEDENEGRETGELMSTLAMRFLNCPVEYLGCVPRDKSVLKAVSSQSPFLLAFPDAAAAKAVEQIAAKLNGPEGAPRVKNAGFNGFLERLGAALKKKPS
jgi:flagellar biosynthesis protein FlhG